MLVYNVSVASQNLISFPALISISANEEIAVPEGIIFNNRTTLQQLQWKALRGLIVAYVTPKDMSGFCKTLYSVMKSRYTVGKKSILGRLPSITPESQIKQWPIFYEFLTTLAKVYSELFLWVQGNVFWGSTPLDIE
jgi:hypothetical protein